MPASSPVPASVYPTPLTWKGGGKVSWNFYTVLKDAEKCAEIAKAKAKSLEKQGYDFGFATPGKIEVVTQMSYDGGWYTNVFKVTLP
jgi:hypothetical protein